MFALLLFAACGDGSGTNQETPSLLEGVITEVTIDDGSVLGFEMETTDGDTREISIDPTLDYGFDLTHLEEHEATGAPVAVETKLEGERLIALSIEDL